MQWRARLWQVALLASARSRRHRLLVACRRDFARLAGELSGLARPLSDGALLRLVRPCRFREASAASRAPAPCVAALGIPVIAVFVSLSNGLVPRAPPRRSDVPLGSLFDMLGARAGAFADDGPACVHIGLRDCDRIGPSAAPAGLVPALAPGRARRRFVHRLKQSFTVLKDSASAVVEASSAAKDAAWGALAAGRRADMEAATCAPASLQVRSMSGAEVPIAVPLRVMVVSPDGDAAGATSATGSAGPQSDWYVMAQPRVMWDKAVETTVADAARSVTGSATEGLALLCDGVDVAALPLAEAWQRLSAPDGFVYVVAAVPAPP